MTPSLYLTSAGMSSQWSSECISCLRPRSNFRVPLTTRAAEFNTQLVGDDLWSPSEDNVTVVNAGRHEGVLVFY